MAPLTNGICYHRFKRYWCEDLLYRQCERCDKIPLWGIWRCELCRLKVCTRCKAEVTSTA